jgi:hypothetical protein
MQLEERVSSRVETKTVVGPWLLLLFPRLVRFAFLWCGFSYSYFLLPASASDENVAESDRSTNARSAAFFPVKPKF